MKDILSIITVYREKRDRREYQLAEHSGLPQSMISSWYRKNMTPSLLDLEKICDAFGLTLSQLFFEGNEHTALTGFQRELLKRWSSLSADKQGAILTLIDKM